MVTMIAAMSKNRILGIDNKLPWHLPADLKRFKNLTTGHGMIMGRKTFESLGSKCLPNRWHFVLSSTSNQTPVWENEFLCKGSNPSLLLQEAKKTCEHVFIIGGAQVFDLFLNETSSIELTLIHRFYDGDTLMPVFEDTFQKISESFQSEGPIDYSFCRYERKN